MAKKNLLDFRTALKTSGTVDRAELKILELVADTAVKLNPVSYERAVVRSLEKTIKGMVKKINLQIAQDELFRQYKGSRLIKTALKLLDKQTRLIQKSMLTRLKSRVPQLLRSVQKVAAKSLVGGERLREIQREVNRFANNLPTGGLRDKAGRIWEPRNYLENAVRGQEQDVLRETRQERFTELEIDLLIANVAADASPICAPWGNVVVSRSGAKGYPSLQEAEGAGVTTHNNCRSGFSAYSGDKTAQTTPKYPAKKPSSQYQNTQIQRGNERQIRKWRKNESTSVSPERKRYSKGKLDFWEKRQTSFLNQTGLPRQKLRELPT